MKLARLLAKAAVIFAACASLGAQSKAKQSETTVEQDYMTNVEDVIITELAASDDYDSKLVALQYLENAIGEGRTSPDMMVALDGLAGEGVNKLSKTNGRLMNNYPDIRAKACDLLGEIPTEQSKNTLVSIATDDREPMVVTAAIRSLGNIGMNDNDEVVNMIEFVHRRYATLNPTSSLALEVLNAYEKLAPSVQDRNAMIQSISEIATNYKYVTPVRTRALELLKSIRSSDSGKSDSKKGSAK
ncbi:MAG: HEAT repeat domain-containing protein [Treponema sp.]|nr:HEAT repeat domain-containing protein [Treponema sp.]